MRRLKLGLCLAMAGLALTVGGCAANTRTVSGADASTVKRASTLTARQWGYKPVRQTEDGVVYRACQSGCASQEELHVVALSRGEARTRVTVHFNGPTAGTEAYFLNDLQNNLT